MYGIRSNTAKFILPAALAIAIAGFAGTAQADGKYYGGHGVHGSYGKYGNPGYYHGKKYKKSYKRPYNKGYRQGYRQGFKNGARYGYGYAPKYGKKFYYKPGYRSGYKPGYKTGYKPGYKTGYKPNHKYWRKYGNHGVTVQVWKPIGPPPRPAYKPYRAKGACHPVVGKGADHFGRRAKFGGTMCYDRYGSGYVVAGSRYVIRYY